MRTLLGGSSSITESVLPSIRPFKVSVVLMVHAVNKSGQSILVVPPRSEGFAHFDRGFVVECGVSLEFVTEKVWHEGFFDKVVIFVVVYVVCVVCVVYFLLVLRSTRTKDEMLCWICVTGFFFLLSLVSLLIDTHRVLMSIPNTLRHSSSVIPNS